VPYDPHLDEDDLDRLLGRELGLLAASAGSPDPLPHAQSCPACREQLDALRQFAVQLRLLHPAESAKPLDDCPQQDVWLLLAAGLLPAARSEALLDHAVSCDACALQLHDALADLADPATPLEAAALASETVSSHSWNSHFANQLRERFAPPPVPTFWHRFVSFEFYAWAAASVCLIAVVFWIIFRNNRVIDPSDLIASAYEEKRTIEVRLSVDPRWTPLRVERGADLGTLRMGRTALLRAESEISDHLRRDPDSVPWLDASGNASMLENTEDSVETAVATLEKAHRLDPAKTTVTMDLACAYILRAQFLNRPEDASLAVELLGKVLAENPDNSIAAFNYAIALEKLQLKQRALGAWTNYTTRFSDSPWLNEARQHRDALQAQVTERLLRGQAPLLAPAAFTSALDGADSGAIDARIEQYREVALSQWLPRALVPASRAGPELPALDALASLLASRHADPWLSDLLTSLRASPSALPSFLALSQASAYLETPDDALARTAAEQALDGFTRAGIAPGRLQASLFLARLDQYAHRYAPCSIRAGALLADPDIAAYPWLRIDAGIEAAMCSRVGGPEALANVRAALALSAAHRFPFLLARAHTAEIGIYAILGDQHSAWAVSTDALASWWNSSAPDLRGYNLLTATYEMYRSNPHWFIETEILSEAANLVGKDPRSGMIASLDTSLALAQLHTGDTASASANLARAKHLIDRTPSGPERDYLSAEVQLVLARIDLADNRPQQAVQRLERIRPAFLSVAHNRLILDFFDTSSTAYLRAGQPQRAEQDLRAGIALDQSSLPQIATDTQRLHWTHLHESLYRSLVEIELRSDPARAFRLWQDFKGAVLRASIHLPAASAKLPPNTAVVSYFQMPAGIYIWVRSGSQIRGRLVPISDYDLRLAATNLLERCSDPNTAPDAWRPYAAQLHHLLIDPIQPWLAGASRLVIEPDGPLKQLPFALLLDSRGSLLADRFDISISPGIDFLRAARPWTGITAASRALVIGNPSVPGWTSLPEVATEVSAVAASFSHPDLVTGSTPNSAGFARQLAAAQVFHFSGHAESSTRSVALVQAGGASTNAIDLEALRHGQLAVLSACSTSHGATGLFDDADSPVHRLLTARVPAVVASRWNVDSEATAQLMQAFYAQLLRGADPAKALRRAATTVRNQPLYSHPYYWASFAVYGRG
jgi:CHAT domain-containing protein